MQETHLISDEEIPKKLSNFDHLYHILATHATADDKGAGIILFINKTEVLVTTEELHPGRLLFAQVQNKITNEFTNIFSFYGKSHAPKKEIINIISKISQKVIQNNLGNVIVCGDFNFVTSLLDRNSNAFTSMDNNYRYELVKYQINLVPIDSFRVTNPKKRLYTYTQQMVRLEQD